MKSVIVVGNARSGTSMTTGLLSILGVEMHQTPLKTESEKVLAQNPKGAFENATFIKLTTDMHKDYRSGDSQERITKKYDQRIKETIRDFERKPMWGFKSAVTAPFLPMFVKHVQNPHVVCVLRNLLPNAQSWIVQMRDIYGENISLDHALDVMSNQQSVMLENLKDITCPKHFTTYEGIKKDAWGEAQKLAAFLKIPAHEKEQQVKEFIMPNYSTLIAS